MAIVNPSATPAPPVPSTFAVVQTFADARSLTGGTFSVIEVLGRTAVGDGWDGVFYWSSASSAADDNATILAPSDGSTGRWLRVYNAFNQTTGAGNVGYTPTSGALSGVAHTVASFLNKLGQTGTNLGAALLGFIQSGTGAQTRDVQTVLRATARSGDFDTNANYLTALNLLSETFGVAKLHIKQSSGVRYQTSTGYGPLASHSIQSTFNSTVDNILMFASYNISEGTAGTKVVSTEPTLAFQMEADYNNGTAHLMEVNLDYTNAGGTVAGRRFLGFSVDRSSDKGTWSFNADTIDFKDSTSTNQFLLINATSTAADCFLSAGTTLNRAGNNAAWLSQRNAANSAYVELVRLNASNQVQLAPGAGQTLVTGVLGVGEANAARSIYVNNSPTGTQQTGVMVVNTFGSGATASIQAFNSGIGTAAAAFTAGEVIGFLASNVVKGAGSTITIQEGFRAADQTGGNTNLGFRGLVSSGTGKWNLFMDGTADNFLEGRLKFGATGSAANNAQTVTVGNVGPGTAAVSILSWAKVLDSSGNVRYIPLFG